MCRASAKVKVEFEERLDEFEQMKVRAQNIEEGLIDLRQLVNDAIQDIDDYFEGKETA